MDIKEIALRIGEKADEYADAKLQSKGEFHPDWHTVRDEYFAEALVAELAKQNKPCAFLHEWIEHHAFGDIFAGVRCAAITSNEKPFDSSDTVSPLFTLPPTAEQIANETAWRDIETAPKDAFVLLAGPSGYTTIETVFTTGRMCSDYHKGRWIDHANDDLTDWGFEPTHWMPLPTPPKRSMEGEQK